MLIVALACPTCGAAGRHAEGSLFAMCEHCGKILARHRDAIESGAAAMRRAYLAIVAPNEHSLRLTRLSRAIEGARALGDRDRFVALATEALLIEIAADPARVPPKAAVAPWVRAQIAARTLCTFEPELQTTFVQLPVSAIELDPRGAGTAHLATLGLWAHRLMIHPRYPAELRDQQAADSLARDAYRVALASAAPMLSADALAEALAVIGIRTLDGICARCGGPYGEDDAAVGHCPWCRSAIEFERTHPWVEGLARIASGPHALPRSGEERATIALQLACSNATVSGRIPKLGHLLPYLRRVVADVDSETLRDAIELVRPGVAAIARTMLDELALALDMWIPEGLEPPALPVEPSPPTVEAAFDDPWVRAQLLMWERPESDLAMTAMAYVITALVLGGTLAATQVVAWFERTGVPPDEAIRACVLYRSGAKRAAASLLDETILLVRRRQLAGVDG